MRIARRLARVALVSAGALLLTGCMPTDPEVVPPPESSSTPIFASDEEALEAATEAYEAYQEVLNDISRHSGQDPERIATVVTTARLSKELEGLESLAASGRRLVGDFIVGATTLQQMYMNESGAVVIVIYACVDPTSAQILDAQNIDVTPEELRKPWPREVTFESLGGGSPQLLLSGDESWSGGDPC